MEVLQFTRGVRLDGRRGGVAEIETRVVLLDLGRLLIVERELSSNCGEGGIIWKADDISIVQKKRKTNTQIAGQ